MSELIQNFTNPAWLFSVFVVGIVVNLISSYLKAPLDRLWAFLSETRAAQNAQAEAKRAARIAKLRASDRAIFLEVRKELGSYLWTGMLYATAALLLVVGNADYAIFATASIILKFFANVLGIAVMFFGMHALRSGLAASSEIDEALREPKL